MESDWSWDSMGFDFLDSKSNMDSSDIPTSDAAKRRKVSADKFVPSCTGTPTPFSFNELRQCKPRKSGGGASTLRRVKPIKSHVPYEIWLDIFSYCTPAQLAQLRRVNSSFKKFIDDEKVWAKSRVNTFPQFPEPLYGYPENYMWNLWKGIGCMICGTARVKKVYWTWAVRLCLDCFKVGKIRSEEIEGGAEFVNHAKVCLRHCFVSGKSVAAERDVYYGGDPAYWGGEVKAFREEYEEYKAKDAQTPGILATFLAYRVDVTREQMKAAGRLQKFERREIAARREELAEIRKHRNISIPERCKTDFSPPISEAALALMPSYQSALRSGSVFTERSWRTLSRKLMAERVAAERQYADDERKKKMRKEDVLEKRRALKAKECRDQKNLQVLRDAMPSLLRYAKNFVKKEAGQLFLDRAKTPSLILEALGYVRRTWYNANPDKILVLRAVNFLWENLFEEMNFSREIEFICQICGRVGKLQELFHHIANAHSLDEEITQLQWTKLEFEFLDRDRTTTKSPLLDWDGAEWPEVLPVSPAGPRFTPLVLKPNFPGHTSHYAGKRTKSSKNLVPVTGGIALPKPTNTLRDVVDRFIKLAKGIDVPPIFKLTLFLQKLFHDDSYCKVYLTFNALYYELSRLSGKHGPSFLTNEYIYCKYCVSNKIPTGGHPGEGNFINLMDHFCQVHYAQSDFEDKDGLADWKRDMFLFPGPLDVVKMWNKLDKDLDGRRWNRLTEDFGLDSRTSNEAIGAAKASGRVLVSMKEWGYRRVWDMNDFQMNDVEPMYGEDEIEDGGGEDGDGDGEGGDEDEDGLDDIAEMGLAVVDLLGGLGLFGPGFSDCIDI